MRSKEKVSIKKGQIKQVSQRVLALSLPHQQTLLIGFLALALGSGINLLFPYVIRVALNGGYGINIADHLPLLTVVLVGLFAIQGVFFYIRHYCFYMVGYRVVARLRQQLFAALMRQDVAFFDRSRIGDLLSRLSADAEHVQRAVTINLSVAVRYALQVLGGTALMFVISIKLTFIIIGLIPLIVFASVAWGKKLRVLSRKMQTELGEASVVAEESMGAIKTVRIFAGAKFEQQRYDTAIEDALVTGQSRAIVAAVFSSTMVFVIHSAIAVVVWLGGTFVLSGALTIGDLTAFVLYCVIVAVSFGFLANTWDEFMRAVGASERIFEVIDTKSIVTTKSEVAKFPRATPPNKEHLSFEAVFFSYPSRPSHSVLDHLSFVISEGQTVALVGPSGSGKSTIAALIPRFYDVTYGRIRYRGVDIRDLSLDEFREKISIVEQQPQVFSCSIRDNISYGKSNATQEEIVAAAKAASIHDFIISLKSGYDTLVGDRGVLLSGGERQRLAIARAILKDPEILILDEATSALDSENEKLVQAALERLMSDRTTLIIAHRLSTIKNADQVIVLRSGKIVQTGNHESLMAQEGLYKSLVQHQLLEV